MCIRDRDSEYLPNYVDVGSPIEVQWTSPKETHSERDWIGLYRIIQTSYSRNKTLLSSSGRWTFCKESSGKFTFAGNKLFWEEGVYEFRYHLNGLHDVAYISEPFEVRIPSVSVPLDDLKSDELAKDLQVKFFSKLLNTRSVDDSISEAASESDNVLEVYKLLSKIISQATNVLIGPKVFLQHDAPNTVATLSSKIIHIKKVLEELSNIQN